MKTLSWFGFFGPTRTVGAKPPGRLARFMELLSRGSIPVDGFAVPKETPAKPRNPEPVRWGNFR